jgi:hypothetical protein
VGELGAELLAATLRVTVADRAGPVVAVVIWHGSGTGRCRRGMRRWAGPGEEVER